MAIYTQYGRYIKAKLFKQALESGGGCYMALGVGNFSWSNEDPASMKMAPYNTDILTDSLAGENPFEDSEVCQHIITGTGSYSIITNVENSVPADGTSAKLFSNQLPVFPAIWENSSEVVTLFGESITASEYKKYYLTGDPAGTLFTLHKIGESISASGAIPTEDASPIVKQVFAELYLRGLSIENGLDNPVGLLGMVRGDVSFVKDIGGEENYTGDINQFWYGDRYWEIVEPASLLVSDGVPQTEYPHHLLISATVNPLQLCSNLAIDSYITPRQLAIYHKVHNNTGDERNRTLNCYPVSEYCFNFGQPLPDITSVKESKILDLNIQCEFEGSPAPANTKLSNEEFEFILHDYIKGTMKAKNQVDRFGYIVGF